MADDKKHWNVMWSHQQNAFHIETMAETIQSGRNAFRENRQTQYVLVASGLTNDEAHAFTATFRDLLHVRDIQERSRLGSPFDGAI